MSLSRARCWYMASGLVVALSLTAGCASVKTYKNSGPTNMYVSAEIDSGSATISTVAEFDIHRVNAQCELQYQGRAFLDKAQAGISIPTGNMVYLDFIFASKRFMSDSASGVRYGTLMMPRQGYTYQPHVKYKDGIYSVVIYETGKGLSHGRELDRMPLSDCKVSG